MKFKLLMVVVFFLHSACSFFQAILVMALFLDCTITKNYATLSIAWKLQWFVDALFGRSILVSKNQANYLCKKFPRDTFDLHSVLSHSRSIIIHSFSINWFTRIFRRRGKSAKLIRLITALCILRWQKYIQQQSAHLFSLK